MLKTEDLNYFMLVAKHGGFSAASKVSNVDAATLSRAIARLEAELNCSLFRRTTRKVELTPEGKIFASDVQKSLQTLSNAREKINNLKDTPHGKLRVNAASSFILHALSPLVKPFLDTYPHIEIELTADDTVVDLLEKKSDVAIRIGTLEDSSLKSKLIGRSPLSLVASPEYLSNYGMPQTAEDLLQHCYLGFQNAAHLNILRFDKAPTLTPYILASNGEVLRQLCLAGNGIAYLSHFMIYQDLEQGRLVPLLQNLTREPNDRERIQAVYYNTTVLPTRIRAFIDFISQHVKL